MDKRTGKRASNDCMVYFLDKYRPYLQRLESERRKMLKQMQRSIELGYRSFEHYLADTNHE